MPTSVSIILDGQLICEGCNLFTQAFKLCLRMCLIGRRCSSLTGSSQSCTSSTCAKRLPLPLVTSAKERDGALIPTDAAIDYV
jgi:hypothetical protein